MKKSNSLSRWLINCPMFLTYNFGLQLRLYRLYSVVNLFSFQRQCTCVDLIIIIINIIIIILLRLRKVNIFMKKGYFYLSKLSITSWKLSTFNNLQKNQYIIGNMLNQQLESLTIIKKNKKLKRGVYSIGAKGAYTHKLFSVQRL